MPPFCGFPNSGEAHLLLFMTSYRNGSEDEPNSYRFAGGGKWPIRTTSNSRFERDGLEQAVGPRADDLIAHEQ